MKIRTIYFSVFLTSASAYIPGTPGSHESLELPKNLDNANKVAPSPDDLKEVASHGMLGGTSDLMKRLSLGSDYAVARHPEESEDAPEAEEKTVEITEEPKEIKLEQEAKEVVAKLENESLQETIKPTKVKVMTEEKEEPPKVELTVVEDVEEDAEQLKIEAEAAKEPIVTGWDEPEEEKVEEDKATPVVMETEESAPIMQNQAEPPIQDQVLKEEPLPYSPYSRQHMIGLSAVDDFSAKFDEKLQRRLTRPAFVGKPAHPNAQAVNQAPSAAGNVNLDILPDQSEMGQGIFAPPALRRQSPRPPNQRIGYLSHEHSCESWFDTKSKVTSANSNVDSAAQEENIHKATSPPSRPQPSVNWFDTQSKVTDAIYGDKNNQEPTLQEKNRKAMMTGQSAYFSNRYSYDTWHENPQSNTLFMGAGHIE